ncbi:MAG: hypothetical protein ACUVQG_06405 [Thermogutta sp.]
MAHVLDHCGGAVAMLNENSQVTERDSSPDKVKAHFQSVEMVAKRRFDKSGYPSLRRLSCHYDGRRLIIRGQVGSYFEKQMAQASLRDLASDLEIVNETEVSWPSSRSDGSI